MHAYKTLSDAKDSKPGEGGNSVCQGEGEGDGSVAGWSIIPNPNPNPNPNTKPNRGQCNSPEPR
jgi:hypothetical protein